MEHVIDITNEHCPMAFIKVKSRLYKLDVGDRLKAIVSKGDPLYNVPRTASELGYKVAYVEPRRDGFFNVMIEKISDYIETKIE